MKKKIRPALCFQTRYQFQWTSRLRALLMMGMLLLVGAPIAQAQLQPLSPFSIVGFIDKATLNPPGDVLAGGTITVNGQLVIVPRNIIVLMPANALTWQQVFAQAPLPYGPTQTGLAIQDVPQPLTTYQATINGNRVGNNYIAGTIAISPDALSIGQGFINFIDYALGEMRVGGILNNPNSGIRLRINDPIGKFGRANTPDSRFTIDEENPTIRTVTGFPMCFPKVAPPAVDANCPTGNRPPEDGPITNPNFPQMRNFPFRAAPGPGVLPTPWLMMPLEVGDFIDYAGITVSDTTGTAGPLPINGTAGTYISAYAITGNLSVYTVPGTDPAYLSIDVLLVETGPFLNPLPAQPAVPCVAAAGAECGKRTRLEGFTTDLGRIIQLNGVHIDPITGATTDSFHWNTTDTVNRGGTTVTVAVPDTDPLPPVGAQPGRWRFRPSAKFFAPYGADVNHAEVPATVHASLVCPQAPLTPLVVPTNPGGVCIDSNLPRTPNAGTGLVSGHYSAPIFDFISVENIIGAPPVPINYEDYHLALGDPVERSGFFFLWRGQGPVGTVGGLPAGTGPIVGRLNPFPASLGPVPPPPGIINFTGGLTTDLAFFRPSDGTWHIHPAVGLPFTVQWGTAGDVPVAGDYDGDGITDFAVWRPSDGNWYVLNSSGVPGAVTVRQWGTAGDVSVPGDYDGDGKADFAVYRPSDGHMYILNSLTGTMTAQQWGLGTDIRIRGDFNGDRKADISVWRPSDGYWYTLNSSALPVPWTAQQWGLPTDIPVHGDFDGDGKADIAVWRPSDGYWYTLNSSALPVPWTAQQWGSPGDKPVPGDYDGDGKTDIAVYRPSDGNWYIINSAAGLMSVVHFPLLPGDIPISQ